MESILLHQITTEEFFERLRTIIKEEIKIAMQQDQLLTKEGALKMAGISNAVFLKAINDGIVKPQLVKGRKKAMYLESEVLCRFRSILTPLFRFKLTPSFRSNLTPLIFC